VITLGQGETDKINQMIIINDYDYLKKIGPMKFDRSKWLITITVITLSSFHLTLRVYIFVSNPYNLICTAYINISYL
jgi:hypothetical protein